MDGKKSAFSISVLDAVAAGMRVFAWWRDGEEVVGSSATPLKTATKKLYEGVYDDDLLLHGLRP